MAKFFHHSPEPTFADVYRPMSELELQDLLADWHSLVLEARSALAAELASRGLEFVEPPLKKPTTSSRPSTATSPRSAVIAISLRLLSHVLSSSPPASSVSSRTRTSSVSTGKSPTLSEASASKSPLTDVEAAEAILTQPIPDSFSISPTNQASSSRGCPRRTSTDISWECHGGPAPLASLYLFSPSLPRGGESWHCDSCGLRWVDEDDNQTQAAE